MKNILIVEDSKVVNNIIAKEFSALGYKCHQAFNFKKAEVFLKALQYNLIILDLHLPDGEGYDLISKVKNLSDSKVVVLTANTDRQLREELFQHGILDYIVKDKNLSFALKELHKILINLSEKRNEKILVIDDSKFICKQIKIILGPRNYDITTVHTAKEGYDALCSQNFDLVTLDIELPDINGNEVLLMIKENAKISNVPVLVLSGTTDASIIRGMYKAGASDFIKKPFVIEEFVLKVDLWIDYNKKHKDDLINKNKILSQQSRMATMGEMLEDTIYQSKEPISVITKLASEISNANENELLTNEMIVLKVNKILESANELNNKMNLYEDFFVNDTKSLNFDLSNILEKAILLISSKYKTENIKIITNFVKIDIFGREMELLQVFINVLNYLSSNLKGIDKKMIVVTSKISNRNVEIMFQNNNVKIDKEEVTSIFDIKLGSSSNTLLIACKSILQDYFKARILVSSATYVQGNIDIKGINFLINIPFNN
jgi:DNA-binding response OmpR family regulator